MEIGIIRVDVTRAQAHAAIEAAARRNPAWQYPIDQMHRKVDDQQGEAFRIVANSAVAQLCHNGNFLVPLVPTKVRQFVRDAGIVGEGGR